MRSGNESGAESWTPASPNGAVRCGDGGEPDVDALLREVRGLRAQLAQSQRMAALGELVGTTTHEFNNVLMTVINYAKLGLRASDAASRQKAFERILAAGQRASKITATILGAARNRSASFEATDLAVLVEDALVLLDREMQKHRIVVEREFRPSPPALVSGNQIQQVLINLLINARQAMPQGGRIVLRIAPDAERSMVQLTVRDSGTGMDAETLHRIFEPHFSTKTGPDATGKGGTGLGLSACREIIEAHRGRIRVESAPGRGTAFTILLPTAAVGNPVSADGESTSPTALPPLSRRA
ncbi:MAG: sensor histidine kinase [Planctomycetes bacterium]|nr:sensor histidine kinase [Planctomycetota bacterium]